MHSGDSVVTARGRIWNRLSEDLAAIGEYFLAGCENDIVGRMSRGSAAFVAEGGVNDWFTVVGVDPQLSSTWSTDGAVLDGEVMMVLGSPIGLE